MSRNGHTQATLGAIADFMNGGAWNQTEYSDEGVPVVRVTDIKGETVDLSDCKFLPKSSLAKYERHLLETGDLVICTVGSHPTQPGSVVGRAAVMPPIARGALLNQNAVRIRSALTHVDQGWLGYLGRSKPFHDYIISCARGSANQVRMAIGLLKEMPVEVPPLPVQRRIAGILSAYDELMENSQRRIRILETMARALYREWFVHFRFPGHETRPRVASPLGDIPKGWEVASLAALCSRMESGGTPKRTNSDYWDGGDIDWYKTGELWDEFLFDSQEKITALGQRESNARLFEPGTILMAIYGSPTVGRMGILTRKASCNQAALGLVANRERISQTLLFFILLGLRDHFNGLAQGAAQQNISKEKVANASAIVPPRALVAAFDKLAEPIFEQVETLQRQIQDLCRTRDLLLPRLLSGQVNLKEN